MCSCPNSFWQGRHGHAIATIKCLWYSIMVFIGIQSNISAHATLNSTVRRHAKRGHWTLNPYCNSILIIQSSSEHILYTCTQPLFPGSSPSLYQYILYSMLQNLKTLSTITPNIVLPLLKIALWRSMKEKEELITVGSRTQSFLV